MLASRPACLNRFSPPARSRRRGLRQIRPGIAAVEFCIVASVLFMIILGMIEIGRAMMALGSVANAARISARAGSVTSGSYTDVVNAAQNTLAAANIGGTPQITVTVNGTAVTDDTTFRAAAVAGSTISVKVGIPYSSVSWLPAGTGIFLSAGQTLSETAVLCKEG